LPTKQWKDIRKPLDADGEKRVSEIKANLDAQWKAAVRPWEHAYETEDESNKCVTCGLIGAYIHTEPKAR
jgi:hypothetical protein